MKRLYFIGIVLLAGFMASCEDSIPFRYDPDQPDSLATRQYPHAFFVVQGTVTDSLSLEPVPEISVTMRTEDPVFTKENGSFSVQTTAFPISQEFRLIINGYGEFYNPLYPAETLYVHFMLPTFQLTQEDIREYGPRFFGRAFLTINETLCPFVNE
jgi:hypothetical protein